MFKQSQKCFFYGLYLAASIFLSTCGLEENYYLPQVPETNIRTGFTTDATINLPSLTSFYYALNYSIYYRIYTSDFLAPSAEKSLFNNISSALVSDYNAIYPNTDPTSTTAPTPANILFKNRNYFELELDGEDIREKLTKSGGNISIKFPTENGAIPELTFNGDPYFLLRSKELFSPEPDKYFRNTAELSDPAKATANINADVAGRSGLSQHYAYVSMYIVATGSNPSQFTPIYSKPTHISIFKLPEN